MAETLDVRFGKNAALVGPVTFWKAFDAPVLEVEGAFETVTGEIVLTVEIQPVDKSDFTDWLNWSEGNQSVVAERMQKKFEYPATSPLVLREILTADGVNRVYRLGLTALPDYKGAFKSLKLSFSENGTARIKRIGLGI